MLKTSQVLSRKMAAVSAARQAELEEMGRTPVVLPPDRVVALRKALAVGKERAAYTDPAYLPKVKPPTKEGLNLEPYLGSNFNNENNRTFKKLLGTEPTVKK
jgi:hypothetical protein